jgi:hypothetical protein
MTAKEFARHNEHLRNDWLRKQPKRDTANPMIACRICRKKHREGAMIYDVGNDRYICKGCDGKEENMATEAN